MLLALQISWVMVPMGAVDTPAAGLEEHHGDEPQHGGGEHDAVKAKGELGNAGMERRAVVSPVPGQLEGPQQRDRLLEILGPGEHQIGVPQHQKEHGKEKGQKAVAESLALHPAGDIFFAGKAEASAQHGEELPPSAVAVAIAFGPADHRDNEGNEEA